MLVVGACGGVRESRFNPLNWFGRSQRAQAVAAAQLPDGGRQQVAEVTELHIERATGGAIIRAKGVPVTQGWYKAELVAEDSENPDHLVYRFVVQEPRPPVRQGTPFSREITAATFVNDFRLEGVRRITVTGAGNARTVNRR